MNDPVLMKQALRALIREGRFVGRTAISRMPHSQVSILPLRIEAKGEAIETALARASGQYLPYPVEEAVIDYIHFHQNSPEIYKVLLIATRRSDVVQHLTLLKGAGLHSLAIDIGPNALFRTFQFLQDQKKSRVLLINVGENLSFFTILWDGQILIDRQAHWGQNRMVDRLVQVLEVDQDEARRMLHLYGLNPQATTLLFPHQDTEVLTEEAISAEIFEITAKELEEFATEAEKVLVYCASENQGASIDQTYLLGSGPFVKHFNSFLQARLGIEVKFMNPFRALQGEFQSHENPSLYGIATGLALRGFDSDGA